MSKNGLKDLMELMQGGGNDAMLMLYDRILEIETKLEKLIESFDREPPVEQKVEKVAMKIAAKFATLEKGDDGYTPQPDKDYPSYDTIEKFIKESIPKKGVDYLTNDDIDEIAKKIVSLIPQEKFDPAPLKAEILAELETFKEEIKNELNKPKEEINFEVELPKYGLAIRDGLELLSGDDRLKIEAIKDLREELDKLKSGAGRMFGGGFNLMAMNIHIIDDETPSGTINGVNKVFTLAHSPDPVGSVKVFLNGARQRVTEDYTISGNTITFTTAPLTGSILLVDYRT